MLKNIFIRNIVLIEKLDISLNSGLIVFSGETGAGKSIILTSLSLAIGKRGDQGLIRQGKNEGSVVVEFEIDNSHPVYSKLKDSNLLDSNDLLIRRIISKDGKSKAFINDSPVTIGYLQQIGSYILEIHGQNEKIGLLDPSSHLRILDKFGQYIDLKSKIRNAYVSYTKLKKICEEAINIDRNKISYTEDLKNKLNMINTLNIKEKEEEVLLKKRNLMAQYDKIFTAINEIFLILTDDNNSFISKLSSNFTKLEKIAEKTDTIEEIKIIVSSLNNVLLEAKEILSGIKKIKDNYSFDTKDLEFAEQRLFDIHNIAKKLQVDSLGLPKLAEKLSSEIENIENSSENIEKIKQKLDFSKNSYWNLCQKLSEARIETAKTLEDKVNNEFIPLKLLDAKFRVAINFNNIEHSNIEGKDNVKFLVKLNKGTKEGEIHKISSGGELSRLMLALNLVLSGSLNRKTIIFDEVDSGVSGAVADAVGTRLQSLAVTQQVLVVTHLPQVASRGKQHFKSFKFSNDNDTFTGLQELNYNSRIEEIAKMMSGENISEEAKKMANKLMENN